MEALDQAEGPAASQREMPPPPPASPPSEPAQKPPPRGTGSHSLTARSSLCLLAASQFLVRTSQASRGLEGGRVEGRPPLPPQDGHLGTQRSEGPSSCLRPSGWCEEKPGVPSHSLDRLEFPRETGLILRCAGKAGTPGHREATRRMTQRLLLGSPTSGGPLTVLLTVDPVG